MVITEAALSKDFGKKPFEEIDRTFLLALLFSALLHFGTVGYFVQNPIALKSTESSIRNIQEQYANVVLKRVDEAIAAANALTLDRPVISPEEVKRASEIKDSVGRRAQARKSGGGAMSAVVSSGRSEGSESRTSTGGGSPSGRQQVQQQIENQVASEGILGILTSSSGSAAPGGQVQDVLGDGSSANRDYEQVFRNVDRLTTSGSGSKMRDGAGSASGPGGSGSGRGEVRGSRTTQGGNIDALVSDLGAAKSSDVTRKTDLVASTLAPLTEEGEEVKAGSVSAGARDVDEVSSIVQEHSPAIKYCYERELKRNPDMKGKVVVRFTITPAGTVTNVKIISSTLDSETVERCILSRISHWDDFGVIDQSLGNATFRQVFSFGF